MFFEDLTGCFDSCRIDDISKEAKFQGVIGKLEDRVCPTSGDMVFHITLKAGNETYEVHVAPVKFAKIYEATFRKGDAVEIIGVKIQFRGAHDLRACWVFGGCHSPVARARRQGQPW